MNEKKNMAQNNEDAITRGKFWGTIAMAVVLVFICVYAFTITLSAEKTSINSIAKGIFIFTAAANLISIALTFRHRQDIGFGLSFSSSLILVIAGTLLLTGRALALSILLLIVSVIGIWWLSSRQSRQWYFIAATVTLILAWVIEWINPAWRLPVKALPMGPIGAVVFAIIFVAIMRIRFWKIASSSLQFKITLWSGLTLASIAIILIAYSTIIGRQVAIDAAQKEALSISNAQALSVSEKLDLPLTSARTMTFALKGIKDPVNPISLTRDQVNKMLHQLNVENSSFLGTYTLWEPNAFDGLDNQYKNTPAHDATGRFIPYWVRRADGSVTVEALLDYETPGIGDWYVLPRQLKKEVVLAPLVYPINGIETVMASFVVPIMQGNKFYGIAGVDAPISFVQGMVDGVNLYNGNANAVLLTSSGTVIGYRSRPELVNQPATEVFADYKDLQPLLEKGEAFISLSPDGKDLRVFSPVEIGNTGIHWSFGLIIPFSEITASATASAIRQGVIGLVLALVALVILWFLSGQIVRPVSALTKVANAVSQGNLNVTADVQASDETGVLANAFNLMITQLRESFATLEARVADRTRNLELAGEVGRTVSQVRALDVMLTEAAELIRAQFDLYYVQVYLTNPSQTALIIQSGTGKVGEELIRRHHQLPLNTTSINGRAAIEKRSVVITDTTASATFRPNPLLPDTRSEMAVPLLIGEKVVGVLDLQSKQTGALSQDILAAFEALAGQLAIAIQNANFLSQVEQARAEIESQARHQTRSNWIDYMDAVHKPEETGFVFEQNKVTSLSMAEQSQLQINDNALIAPISVTGEPLGNLVVEMEGQSPISRTSELVNTVARQVSQQIESLRLLESAERYRFEAEEATRHTTREGWKDYMQVNADENMSYIYDLNEVRPFNQNDEQQRDYSATTLPLKVRNENIGKLVVQGLGSDDTESLELAKAVAERLSTHIESLRLAEQTQNTLLFNEKLYSASRAITSTHNEIETALELIKHIEHTNLDRVVIAMKVSDNPVTAQVVAVWDRNGMEDRFLNNRFTDQQIPLVSQMHWDEAMLVNDFNDAPHIDPVTQKTFMALGVKSAAIVPISGGGNLLGWILLETTHALTQFSPESVQAYLSLAGQAATVIQGQRLLAQSQQQAERESTLNTISQKIQSATTVEAVLQIAARELGHALGAPMTIAQLSMKDKK